MTVLNFIKIVWTVFEKFVIFNERYRETSRDRPKSAPYPRLKNSKKTSKCQVFSFTVLENRKFFEKKFEKLHTQKNGPTGALKSHNAEKLKGGTLWGFSTSILSQNMKKLKKTKIFIFGEKSHNAEKNWKGGPFAIFQHPFCRKTWKNAGGALWGKFFLEKSLAVPKKMTLWSNSAIWCNNIL